jgi:hypothetical protein
MRGGERLRPGVVALVALGGACTPPGDTGSPSTESTPFACTLGVPTEEGWKAWGDTLELEMGFQGFVLAQLQLTAGEDAPESVTATMLVEPEGSAQVSGSQPLVAFTHDGALATTDPILVFFTSNYISYYVGLGARVAVRLDGEGKSCAVEGQATLVDDDPCLHTGDEPICPEDSGFPEDTGTPGDTAADGGAP